MAQAILRQDSNDSDGIWRHRLVGLIDGQLGFVEGPPLQPEEARDWTLEILQTETTELPPSGEINDHQIAEYCPLAAAYTSKMAHHLKSLWRSMFNH